MQRNDDTHIKSIDQMDNQSEATANVINFYAFYVVHLIFIDAIREVTFHQMNIMFAHQID